MVFDRLPTQVLCYPDPRLREKCAPIEVFDESVAALAARMLELMREHNGVGLAGPQVGVCRRIFVANPTGKPQDDRVFINPELSDLTGMIESDEGCLSIPEVRVNLKRARRCRVRAVDAAGSPIDITAEDLLSRIVQHETDHLNGRLIIDSMDSTDKIANKKQLAQLEADYRKG